MLVCLAATLSMVQANLLMNTVGKPSNSFVALDPMRLPLHSLSCDLEWPMKGHAQPETPELVRLPSVSSLVWKG